MDNQQIVAPEAAPANTPAPTVVTPPKTNKRKLLLPVLTLVVVVLVGLPVGWGIMQTAKLSDTQQELDNLKAENSSLNKELDKRKVTTGEANIDKKGFQAVFLTSGQVYFGKITTITETQLTLTDIFYLKGSTATGTDVNNPTGDVSLVKLGSELHGPQDTMYIERKEVNFWENLKSDGKVVRAILQYERQNPGP
jgi:hypothetical protein